MYFLHASGYHARIKALSNIRILKNFCMYHVRTFIPRKVQVYQLGYDCHVRMHMQSDQE